MRTTLTLDDDLAEALKARARRSGQPFKTVLNSVVRLGLETALVPPTRREYRIEAASLGEPRAEYDLAKALALSDALEDAELARKLELRK